MSKGIGKVNFIDKQIGRSWTYHVKKELLYSIAEKFFTNPIYIDPKFTSKINLQDYVGNQFWETADMYRAAYGTVIINIDN